MMFDTISDSLDDEILRLESKLKLVSENSQRISDSVLVQSTKNLIPSKTEIYLSDIETDISLDFSILSPDEEEKLILNVPVEGSYQAYHLKFPAVKALQICRKLANNENKESAIESAESHYNKGRIDTCYSILNDASKCLDYEDYLAVRDTLVGEEPKLEETVERDRYASIRNMIMGRSKGKYFKINSASELRRRIKLYNEYDNLENIDNNELVKHILETRYSKNQISRYSPSKLNELRKVLFDPEFVEAASEITEPYFVLCWIAI